MKNLGQALVRLLSSGRAWKVLFLLNVLLACALVWVTRDRVMGDQSSYILLAQGILHGEYSQWYALDEYLPDTWRTPGFPLFVAVIIKLFGTWKAVFVVQLLLYVLSLHLTLKVIGRIDPRPFVKSVFLLCLLPLVNVPYYISAVYPDIPMLASIAAVLYIVTRPGGMRWYEAVALGALYGFMYQCRPVFLLFPPLYFVLTWWFQRGRFQWLQQAVVLVVFGLTLLPYALWNQKNHGKFSVTPLEGGGGMVHFGYWCGRIPNYNETVYWRNHTGDELVRFVPADSVPANIAAYEAEWAVVKEKLKPFLTHKDSVMMAAHGTLGLPACNTFNTAYTLEREKLLLERTKAHIREHFGYYALYKAYSAVRLWIIGIQRHEWAAAGTVEKLKMLYAPIVTGIIFLLTVVLVPLALKRKRLLLRETWPYLTYLLYFGAIHVPFVIQARYTTSVRLVMLGLLALAIGALVQGRSPHAGPASQVDKV